MKHLKTYRLFESLNINEDELKDIMVDIEDDGFEVDYYHHPNGYNTFFIKIVLPSRTGKTITGPYTGETKVVADNYSWSEIKDNVNRLTSYIDSLGLKYKFDMVDSSGKSHRVEIENDTIKCVNNNGGECQTCKYGLPKMDLTTYIYVFGLCVYDETVSDI